MTPQARVHVVDEVATKEGSEGYRLCLQWCRYLYHDGGSQEGYRFIWRRPDGTLQAARGQARIPSIAVMDALTKEAKKKGWGKRAAEDEADYL